MRTEKSLTSSIIIPLPTNLASEFFKESGDLPITKFPATTELANIIGKTLDLDCVEYAGKLTLESLKTSKRPKTRP